MYLSNNEKGVILTFLNQKKANNLFSFGIDTNLKDSIINYIMSDSTDSNKKYNLLYNALWSNSVSHITQVIDNKKLKTLKFLIGVTEARKFKIIWDYSTRFTYTTGYSRRSYRTNKSSKLYLNKNINKLIEYIYLLSINFSLKDYLTSNKKPKLDVSIISDLISIELNDNNKEIFEYIKEIIYNDNNIAVLSHQIIRGVLMSNNKEAYSMIGDLLLASKLQEGLRQAITESMDECSKESFLYLLKIINDNQLYRFSSIVRAFSTWTGINLDVERPKVNQRCFEIAYKCLENKENIKQFLNSSDNLEIYLSLWAIAFDEVEDIDDFIKFQLESGRKYRIQTALIFLLGTQFTDFKHNIACARITESDLDTAVLALKNIFSGTSKYNLDKYGKELYKNYKNNKNQVGLGLFNNLENLLNRMTTKKMVFSELVFPWVSLELTEIEILNKMLYSVYFDYNNEIIDRLLVYKNKMDPELRRVLILHFLKDSKNEKHREEILLMCGDKSSDVRKIAFDIAMNLDLTKQEFLKIENFLTYKSGDLRKNCIRILLKQDSDNLFETIERLLLSNDENLRLAAIDLVSALELDKKHQKILFKSKELISTQNNISQKESLIVNEILNKELDQNYLKSGLGLINVDEKIIQFSGPVINDRVAEIEFFKNKLRNQQILTEFDNFIVMNRDYEYEVTDYIGSKSKVTLGGSKYLQLILSGNKSKESYPLIDEIIKLINNLNIDTNEIVLIGFCMKTFFLNHVSNSYDWFKMFLKNNLYLEDIINNQKYLNSLTYRHKIESYFDFLTFNFNKERSFELSYKIANYLFNNLTKEEHLKQYKTNPEYMTKISGSLIADSYPIYYWFSIMKQTYETDDQFKKYFEIAYNFYLSNDFKNSITLDIFDFNHALNLNLITENELYKEMILRPSSVNNIKICTNPNRIKKHTNISKLLEIRDIIINKIVSIESRRGELNTEVTHLATSIMKFYGAKHFITILMNTEKNSFTRGYNFASGSSTKNEVLSYLLKCCYPDKEENLMSLIDAIGTNKISEKQLIDAAMYAPQWLDLISEYLGDNNLKSICWYFHSHVNHRFSEEKESIVARYSTISTQDFKDGAFDSNWFKDAYSKVTEKRFNLIYDSAKYIADGSLHKRSQLFADAVLERLDIEQVKRRIIEKRNKDYLLVYAVIPITDRNDLLKRYDFINHFIKESKQFGTQRQTSEIRTAKVALVNLANNANYTDVNRMIWDLETVKIKDIEHYFEPFKVDEFDFNLKIDDFGKVTIQTFKNESELKDVPSKYKKHEYIIELNKVRKELSDQYNRAKQLFEEFMEKGESFKSGEIINLQKNPVLQPLIKKLVFITDRFHGFIEGINIKSYNHEVNELELDERVFIAHPLHLYEYKVWAEYQRLLFERKLIQPFKQVFRELYTVNKDEIDEGNKSRRYSGHQVQVKKTLALLKQRGWIISYEEGLQKIYYKDNVVASIYIIADWFSPSDIESPIIEYVIFEDMKTGKLINLDSVPKLVFSEVMRDVDLVVSVAHVGGVDPEASLSTIEIRTVIVNELMKLLKLDNVYTKGSHAHIDGKLGQYTVHLGSGVTHMMGIGALNILPVHSGQRGKIFLPFIDDNPRTSEIISKILLLAEDSKLKDPTILMQMNTTLN